MDRTETELDYIEYTDNSFANTFSFVLEAYPKGDAFKLLEQFDKKTILDIYKMAGQLRMSEEEKKEKRKIKYDQELDDILNKVNNKGLDIKELAKLYGTPI